MFCQACVGTGLDPFAASMGDEVYCITCGGSGIVPEKLPPEHQEIWLSLPVDLPDEAYAVMAEAEGIMF